MDAKIFADFIQKFQSETVVSIRNGGEIVWLLMDNSSTHKIPNFLGATAENWNGGGYWVRGFSYGCLRVAFLPPNTTALVQPMDAGIIRAFKAHFRRFHLLWVISQLDAMGEGVSADKVLPTVRQAIEWTSKAWACVTKQTVQNCWKHVKILPSGADLRLSDESHDALDQLLVLLEDIARNNTVEDPCTAQEFVSIREENLVEDPECDESWMTETYSAAPEPEDSDAEESGDEVEIVPVSLRQARIGLATALSSFLSPDLPMTATSSRCGVL
mmetsp:Transcript_16178/g.43921  ORF Transcript_16178/g.43921 Transcript_16178/m.43921 type:complete len:272 (+) Transcript_16178:917-1732(+)